MTSLTNVAISGLLIQVDFASSLKPQYSLIFHIIDEVTENHFISVNDGKNISQDLPWHSDNPNQGRDANFVPLTAKRPVGLVDGSESRPCCTQCTVPQVRNAEMHILCESKIMQYIQSTVFYLWGTCEDSYFGKYFDKSTVKNHDS